MLNAVLLTYNSDTVGLMEPLFSSLNLARLKIGVPEARSCTVKEHTDIE